MRNRIIIAGLAVECADYLAPYVESSEPLVIECQPRSRLDIAIDQINEGIAAMLTAKGVTLDQEIERMIREEGMRDRFMAHYVLAGRISRMQVQTLLFRSPANRGFVRSFLECVRRFARGRRRRRPA